MADNDFPQRYLKKLDQTFVDAVASMDENEAKQRILTCEGHLSEIENAQHNDEKLQQAKELAKELATPYRENKAIEMAKIRYLVYTLEERGISLS